MSINQHHKSIEFVINPILNIFHSFNAFTKLFDLNLGIKNSA